MTAPPTTSRGALAEFGKFLEIQNLGLNLPFALAFLLAAARGWPSLWDVVWIVVAFVAARNAGHSFNRWADRAQDAQNPRTKDRALVTGRLSGGFALTITVVSGAVLLLAAYLLNPLAFLLAPVALGLLLFYSYSKRFSALTTVYLGLIEGIIPAAVFIAITGGLPWVALVAVAALIAWGTAFETVHSLGDVESDRALGLRSIPVRLGIRTSLILIPALHAIALALLALFGYVLDYAPGYFVAVGAMAVVAAVADVRLIRSPSAPRIPFQLHFVLSLLFLVGVLLGLWLR